MNVHDVCGKNIPADLHNEHLNRLCKEAKRHWVVIKLSWELLELVKHLVLLTQLLQILTLRNLDIENDIIPPSGKHSKISTEKDIKDIVKDLLDNEVFSNNPHRKHSSFSDPQSLLHLKSFTSVRDWIVNSIFIT